MKKLIIIVFVSVFLFLLLLAFIGFNGGVTGAAVSGQNKCIGAKAALKFINEKNCTRIYEDPKCEEKGLVEVQC